MKELSLEEKAKRYDEAIGRANDVLKGYNPKEGSKATINYIFPELRESEDEKIRKRIIQAIKIREKEMNEEWSNEIAWLEKQGSNLVKNGYTNNKDVIEYAGNYSREIWRKLMDNFKNIKDYHIGCNDVSDIVLNAIINTYNWLKKHGEDVPMAVMDEKQGEQKPIDKVGPKFHEGDWLCENELNNYARFIQILEIINIQGKERYRISRDIRNNEDIVEFGFLEKYYHKFDIKDAKDGDVLACDDKDKVFLYNGKLDLRGRVCAYCGIYKTYDGLRFTKCAIGNYFTYKEPYPATKEQRDILFQKMYEAGYTFNFEKKKLKKLKFKVGDEVITENEGSLTITKIDEEGYWSNDLFICDFDSECVWDLVEQKSAWSEEELATIELIEDHAYFAGSENTREKLTEKACEYISKHQCEYIDLDDFRKAMEK